MTTPPKFLRCNFSFVFNFPVSNSVRVYACACVSAVMNLMIATLRTSTIAGWEDITLYLIFAIRLSTLIQLRHLIGPLHLKSFYVLFLVWVSEAVNFSMRLFICEFSPLQFLSINQSIHVIPYLKQWIAANTYKYSSSFQSLYLKLYEHKVCILSYSWR